MNLILNLKCNRKCSYCFAQQAMRESDGASEMNFSIFSRAVKMCYQAKRPVHLLGGEPTLHKDFIKFVDFAMGFDVSVNLFTNMQMPSVVAEALCKLISAYSGRADFNIVANIQSPSDYTAGQRELVEANVKMLSKPIFFNLGFNLYRPDPDISFHLHLINKYRLNKRIRMGLAAERLCGLGEDGDSFNKSYADAIVKLARIVGRQKATLEFDCGIPLCLFTDEQIGKIRRYSNSKMAFECFPAVDLMPDGKVVHCFPVGRDVSVDFMKYESYQDIFNALKVSADVLRKDSFKSKCCSCYAFKINTCHGFCLARAKESACLIPIKG